MRKLDWNDKKGKEFEKKKRERKTDVYKRFEEYEKMSLERKYSRG